MQATGVALAVPDAANLSLTVSAPIISLSMAKSDMVGSASPAATQIDLGEQQITVTIEVRWGLND